MFHFGIHVSFPTLQSIVNARSAQSIASMMNILSTNSFRVLFFIKRGLLKEERKKKLSGKERRREKLEKKMKTIPENVRSSHISTFQEYKQSQRTYYPFYTKDTHRTTS